MSASRSLDDLDPRFRPFVDSFVGACAAQSLRRKNTIFGPSTLDSVAQDVVLDSSDFRPFPYIFGDAIANKSLASKSSLQCSLSKAILGRISTLDATANSRIGNARNFGPFNQWAGYPIVGQQKIATSVSGLSAIACPLAIAARIVTVILDALKRHPGRAFSHVLKKGGKRFPLFANFYPAPGISIISSNIGVFAPLMHSAPNTVGTRAAHSMNESVALATRMF